METIKATIENTDGKYFIQIQAGEESIRIPICEDRPNEVKSAFNSLIARIKDGEFKIELEGTGDDLFSQVSIEYVKQLNREILEVHGEMKKYGLVEDSGAVLAV